MIALGDHQLLPNLVRRSPCALKDIPVHSMIAGLEARLETWLGLSQAVSRSDLEQPSSHTEPSTTEARSRSGAFKPNNVASRFFVRFSCALTSRSRRLRP